MAVRAKRAVEEALKQKGFRQEENHHHFLVYWTADGLKTHIRTKTSHGSTKDLGDHLLSQMARQVKLPKPQFLSLIDCPMDRQTFEHTLRNDGSI